MKKRKSWLATIISATMVFSFAVAPGLSTMAAEPDIAELAAIETDEEIQEAGSDETPVEETIEINETESSDTEEASEDSAWKETFSGSDMDEVAEAEEELDEDAEEESAIMTLAADDEIQPLDGETVAKIGDQEYTSIQDAIDASGTADTTITMTADTAEDITIGSNQTITLDMSGCTITGAESTAVGNYGTLIIKNGTVTGVDGYSTCGIGSYSGSNLSVENVSVVDNTITYGGIYFMGDKLTVSGCTISGNISNDSSYSGAGIHVGSGDASIFDSTICDNNYQGGIVIFDSTASISDCIISNNYASVGGGLAIGRSTVNISGCTINGNSCRNPGGGIYNVGSKLNIYDSVIKENSCYWDRDGGGIYNSINGMYSEYVPVTTIYNTVICNNSESGVCNANGTFIMVGGAIYGNTNIYGGADVVNYSGAEITLIDATSMQTDGYPVTGWYYDERGSRYADTDDPVEYTPIASNTSSLYLIAAYAVTVSYDLNGGSGTVPEDSTSKDESASGTAASGDGLTAPEGYCQFTGWNTAADGSGTSYEAGEEYSFMTDTTLYAQWSEHTYSGAGDVTKPTCTEQGYTTYTCSVCGYQYKTDYTDATGHSWDDGVVIKEATATEDGEILYTCTVCGATRTETIAATGNDGGNDGSGTGENGNNGSGSSGSGGSGSGSGTGGTGSGSGSGSGNGGTESGSTNSTESTGTTNVNTADTNVPILYGILITLAGAAIVTLGVRRRVVRR